MKKRIYKMLLLCFGLAAAFFILCVLYRFTGFGIPCLFYSFTKTQCPACGTFRMLNALAQLDFAAAFNYNAAMLCLLPLLAALLLSYIYKYIKYNTRKFSAWQNVIAVIIIAVLVLFFVYRLLLHLKVL